MTSLGTIANRAEAVRRLVGKLGKLSEVKVCCEAGPTGYALYWQPTQLGVQCEVIAPSLVPMKSGDRIRTDRRYAERRTLARSGIHGMRCSPAACNNSRRTPSRDHRI